MWPFVIIFLVLGVALAVYGQHLEDEARRSARWPVVPGQLEECEVVEQPGMRTEDMSTWRLQLRYSYVVRGVTYHSTRYAFGYGDVSDDTRHRAIAQALRRLPELSVHYDPAHPSEAVLCTEVQRNASKLGYSLLAVAAVAALLALASR